MRPGETIETRAVGKGKQLQGGGREEGDQRAIEDAETARCRPATGRTRIASAVLATARTMAVQK